jgi:hypothetical protein
VSWSYCLRGIVIFSFEQSLDSTLHPLLMIFITQHLPDEIVGLKDHKWQLVPGVHPCLLGTLQWAKFRVVSHRYSVFFRVMCVIVFETQFTAFLHPGSLVSCHSFLICFLHFNSQSRPGRSFLNFDKVIREYGHRDLSCWPRGILCPQKLALTSPTSGGRSVGIVRLRTKATE